MAFSKNVNAKGTVKALTDALVSKVNQGLKSLVNSSKMISKGIGSLPPGIAGGGVAGQNWVLNTVGINPATVTAVQQFNPAVAQQALNRADQVFQQVAGGAFTQLEVPAAAADFQAVELLGSNIFTPALPEPRSLAVQDYPSQYATDLIAQAPKFKFLYIVQIICNSGYVELHDLDLAFVVKKFSRPQATFRSEDINYYNYRTKVVTKTEFEDVDMVFHDDTMNYSARFYAAYLRAMSPIANIQSSEGLAVEPGMGFDKSIIGGGGNFNPIEQTIASNSYTASRGALVNDHVQVIKEIRVFHVFQYGKMMNVFKYLNPRITTMAMDPLDMANSEGCEVSFKFNYDSVYIETDVPVAGSQYAIDKLSRTAVQEIGRAVRSTNAQFIGGVAGIPRADIPTGLNTSSGMMPQDVIGGAFSYAINNSTSSSNLPPLLDPSDDPNYVPGPIPGR